MQSARKNYPREKFFIRRDANQRGRIILGREFLPVVMQSARKNHPRKRILIRRDAISEGESSLGENFAGRDEISGEESSPEESSYPQG